MTFGGESQQAHMERRAKKVLTEGGESFIARSLRNVPEKVDPLTRSQLDSLQTHGFADGAHQKRTALVVEHAWKSSLKTIVSNAESLSRILEIEPHMPVSVPDWLIVHQARVTDILREPHSPDTSEFAYLREDTQHWNTLPWLQNIDAMRRHFGKFSGPFDRAECAVRLMLLDAEEATAEHAQQKLETITPDPGDTLITAALNDVSLEQVVDDSAA